MTIEALYKIFIQNPYITTDTRKINIGDLFFALKGPSFNGNRFAAKALEMGAAYAIIDEQEFYLNEKTIVVEDVLTALQQLAKYHRQQFTIPFIAITGSNGKTTSKELVNAVLSSTYKTYFTHGNLNNHIGVPLTILSVKKDADMAIIEMGANHQKEIESYCEYTLPTHGMITNCGKAHLEGFGGVDGVKKGKGELFDYLRAHHGTAFIMKDYDYLQEMSKGITSIYSYGTADADVEGTVAQSEPFLSVSFAKENSTIQTQLVGAYNLPNILMAVAVGYFFKVPFATIKASIEAYTPSNSRSQLIEKNSNKIILDAYNANPSSMKLAIENMAKINAPKKVLLLGAMAELGEESLDEHQQIIDLISQYTWDYVVLVGGDFQKLKHPFIAKNNSLEAAEWFAKYKPVDSYILVKGSRSMAMEKVLPSNS
jgi:UDP-N-acetylmuramoyl-tripeptide--D-alanyl-D-alanine ligase